MKSPTWGIVATVDEPPQLLGAFAAHHRAIGAAEVHLYLDRPDPEAELILAGLAGLRVTVCDVAYWDEKTAGKRPPLPMGRQRINANDAYRKAGVDWLLHCDADEFLRSPEVIEHRMARAPDDLVFFQLKMLERVRIEDGGNGIFDGVFRRPGMGFEDWGEEVYGRFSKFLQFGLTGHSVGKGLVRTGLDTVRMGVHYPQNADGSEILAWQPVNEQILHFDGLTPLHFMLKLARRLDWPGFMEKAKRSGRGAQMRFTRNKHANGREMARLVAGTQTLSKAQLARLQELSAIDPFPFDPGPPISEAGLDLDLGIAAFDAELRKREPDLIARIA